jgi:murein DD-endopeptidase MepM/ murein hydrolase activator NlpD
MSKLTPSEIYSYALDAGFSPDEAVTFTAIAMAESSGETTANAFGSEDSRGLWQINVSDGVRDNIWGDLYDPAINARAAYEISGGGSNIYPWSVTHDSNRGTSRDYRQYLDEAEAAADDAELGGGSPMADERDVDGPVGQPLTGAAITDTWGAARSGGRTHEGIDIFADEGTPIQAVVGGTVSGTTYNPLGGYNVQVEGDDGRHYYYAHVKEGSFKVEEGDVIDAGQVIAEVGNTGNAASTPPHLHLGIKNPEGEWINPFDFLEGLPSFDELAAAQDDGFDIDSGAEPEPEPPPLDTDHDEITDKFEALLGTSATAADSDGDTLSDRDETTIYHTNPMDIDTDDDTISDADEIAAGSDAGTARLSTEALKAGFIGGKSLYSDSDGFSDLYEIQHGTDPYNADSDGDSINDDLEVVFGGDPNSIDANDDGLVDTSSMAPSMTTIDLGGDPTDPLSATSGDTWFSTGTESDDQAVDGDDADTFADAVDGSP